MKKEKIINEGISALIDKLGYANAVRFIALFGGQGDMTPAIRTKRDKESLDDIVSRIEKRRADAC